MLSLIIKHLTLIQILEIHKLVIETFSKEKGVMDRGNLENALLRTENYHGEDAIVWKAAILLERIILGHPFIDGNKRTAFEACKTFLDINGYLLESSEEEIIDFLVSIAKGQRNRYSVRNWLTKHTIKK